MQDSALVLATRLARRCCAIVVAPRHSLSAAILLELASAALYGLDPHDDQGLGFVSIRALWRSHKAILMIQLQTPCKDEISRCITFDRET